MAKTLEHHPRSAHPDHQNVERPPGVRRGDPDHTITVDPDDKEHYFRPWSLTAKQGKTVKFEATGANSVAFWVYPHPTEGKGGVPNQLFDGPFHAKKGAEATILTISGTKSSRGKKYVLSINPPTTIGPPVSDPKDGEITVGTPGTGDDDDQ